MDSFDQLKQPSTIPNIEETNAESAIGSTEYKSPIQSTIDKSTIVGTTPHSVAQANQTLAFQIMQDVKVSIGPRVRDNRKLRDNKCSILLSFLH